MAWSTPHTRYTFCPSALACNFVTLDSNFVTLVLYCHCFNLCGTGIVVSSLCLVSTRCFKGPCGEALTIWNRIT